jgi:hypothetical protein
MMRFISSIFVLSVMAILCGCSSMELPCAVEDGKISGQDAIFLKNKFLRVGIIPSSNGRIASLVYRPMQCQIMRPYKEKREMIDPLLPEQIFSNRGGHNEWFWNVQESAKVISDMKAEILYDNPNRAGVRLTAKNYCGQDIELTREIVIDRDTSEIKIHVRVKNTGKKTFPLTLWLHSIPSMSLNRVDDIYFPGMANVAKVGKSPVLKLEHNQLVMPGRPSQKNFFVAPARPWSARISRSWPLIFAYILNKDDLQPNGMLYTWSGYHAKQFLQTQEVILNPVSIKPGKSHAWKYKIALYGGMFGVSDIIKGLAIRYRYQMNHDVLRIKFKVCGSVKRSAQWMQIKLKPLNDPLTGKTLGAARVMLPIMDPNKPVTVVADLKNIKKGKYRMTIEIAKSGFRIVPGPIIDVKRIVRFEPK